MKKTPLLSRHQELGGKIAEFGGWAMPIQYQGILAEHLAVRSAAGLFDVSHMGELRIQGPAALDNLQRLVTNDLSRVVINQAIYSPMCAPTGGTVDDLLLYRLAEQDWLLVVNAANIDQDETWIRDHLTGGATLDNASDCTAQLAIQGPQAELILQQLTATPLTAIRAYRFLPDIRLAGWPALVSRTGYTGEDGFEIYLDPADAPALWDTLLAAGRKTGLVPVGLGARDTLRLEAAMPLYGYELSPGITPLEAGLDRFVKLDKTDFIGRDALRRQKENGLARQRVGLEMIDRGIPRSGNEIRQGSRAVGQVTSGSYSPTFRKNIAMAMLDTDQSLAGTILDVVIRSQTLRARVVELPFYSRKPKAAAAGK
jgi:aminomethyltransferase